MGKQNVINSWGHSDPYEQYAGRWSRRIAPMFLAWLGCHADLRWLDVGCGTGILCAAIADLCSPRTVIGIDPSEGFLRAAEANLNGRAKLQLGSAASIPLDNTSVDVVVSGLVLNFVADQPAAMAEMRRVAHPGGVIAAYIWDYADKMEMMRIFWDVAAQFDPLAAQLDQDIRSTLCDAHGLNRLFSGAGLEQIEVTALDTPTIFANFDDYWQPFLGGQGSAPSYLASLDEDARERLRARVQARLPVQPDGSIPMTARAWAIRGQTPK